MPQPTLIERSDVDTGRSYEAAAGVFERAIGRLEPETTEALRARGAPWVEVETEMARMAGPSGLMLFAKIDQGAIASLAGPPIRCRLYLVGNPAIAARIVRADVRGSLYVPFRVALFERDQSTAILSFDRPSSFLSALGRPELDEIGLQLDQKIDAVVQQVKAL
jgi:uncharacterized protein (DUF302 family)